MRIPEPDDEEAVAEVDREIATTDGMNGSPNSFIRAEQRAVELEPELRAAVEEEHRVDEERPAEVPDEHPDRAPVEDDDEQDRDPDRDRAR